VSGVLPEDFSGTLGILNAARKVAVYEGEAPNLQGWSLDALAADVEIAVEAAERENAP
jgi:hypothetical protein